MSIGYFVLIIIMSAPGSSGGNSIATAQFRTQELCDAAAKEARGVVTYNHVQIDTRCLRAY